MNVLKYIKKNPKKSVFGMILCGFVGRYFKNVFEDHEFRHIVCREIMSQGTTSVNWQYNPKTITVFLNPAANNGKATKLFEKNAAPIFHLSGCNVKVVKLEYEGQAKQFMSVLDSTDVIVAAGGNGTVNEVVTGLMRRPDYKAWSNVPIGIIPLGETNRIYYQLCGNYKNDSYSKQIINATNDILKSHLKSVNVMKITGENNRSVYALTDLRWGSYSEAFSRTSKFWFWGPLKKYMTFVFASVKSKTQEPRKFKLEYCDPETLDSVLINKESSKTLTNDPIMLKIEKIFSWVWKSFRGNNNEPKELHKISFNEEDFSKIDFKNSEMFETLELTASINGFENEKQKPLNAQITIEKTDFSSLDFIKNGVKRFSEAKPKSININSEIYSSQFRITPDILTESWFKIDNEEYEAMPCTVSILPNSIKIICSSNNKEIQY